MRLVSVYYDAGYPFDTLPGVTSSKTLRSPLDIFEGDILVVWGGADISPSLYGSAVSQHTYASAEPSKRDAIEWAGINRAVSLGVPIMGVCRGAQMLCARAGGKLIQHLDNHAGMDHMVTTPDGTQLEVNSIHHQMMYPFDVEHEMLAYSSEVLSSVHYDVNTNCNVPCEPELVWFPAIKGMAVQWHPEMMDTDSPATQYVFKTFLDRIAK